LDLTLRDRGAAVLLGLNGAGKSITLKAISGLVPIWKGSIRLAGVEVRDMEAEDRVRCGIGHVLQHRAVFPHLSVDDNLRLGGAMIRNRKRFRDNAERVFSIYPVLAERRRDRAGSLSGGQQSLLAVGRALMAGPRVLLVDEPSAGLSPRMVNEVGETLNVVRRSGTPLLVVEQNVGFALSLADDVYVLERGRVVYARAAKSLDRNRVAALLGIGDLLGGRRAGERREKERATRSPIHEGKAGAKERF
jgi:branched-chain amino acid transport system ATP-binding protein